MSEADSSLHQTILNHQAFVKIPRLGTVGWSMPELPDPHRTEATSGNADSLRMRGVTIESFDSNGNFITFGSTNCQLNLKITFRNASNCHFVIGDGAALFSEITMQGDGHMLVVARTAPTWMNIVFFGHACAVSLGAAMTCNSGFLFSFGDHNSIQIGDDCMFANKVDIRNSDGHAIIDLETLHRTNLEMPIIIGPHVWLGEGASIRKGTEIGAGSIIGAGATTSSKLPPFSVCVGTPAVAKRSGVSWTREHNPTADAAKALKAWADRQE